ncbi:MAG: hypothetical protein ACPGRC_09620 [Salibacteraceae bacterium]
MKRLNLIFLTLMISLGANAQNFYLTASSGYSFGMNGDKLWLNNSKSYHINNNQTGNFEYEGSQESVAFTLGKGFNFGASVGYNFNKYISVDLGINYLLGGKTKTTNYSEITEIETDGTSSFRVDEDKYSDYSRMIRIMPTVVITPGFEKINPYAKVGFVFSFGSYYSNSDYVSTTVGYPTYESTYNSEFSGGVSLGFNAAIGGMYELNDSWSVFGECSFIGSSYSPTKREVVKLTRNGKDELPTLSTYNKETNFSNKIKTSSATPDYDQPREQLKIAFPLSSFGINFGVKMNF